MKKGRVRSGRDLGRSGRRRREANAPGVPTGRDSMRASVRRSACRPPALWWRRASHVSPGCLRELRFRSAVGVGAGPRRPPASGPSGEPATRRVARVGARSDARGSGTRPSPDRVSPGSRLSMRGRVTGAACACTPRPARATPSSSRVARTTVSESRALAGRARAGSGGVRTRPRDWGGRGAVLSAVAVCAVAVGPFGCPGSSRGAGAVAGYGLSCRRGSHPRDVPRDPPIAGRHRPHHHPTVHARRPTTPDRPTRRPDRRRSRASPARASPR